MSAPTSNPTNRPFVLIIRDGWGQNPHPEHDAFNAVKLAKTPVADRLMAEYPNTLIATSGEDVGLPEGTMGNSEVGHMNIGAGRVVDQESVAITKACRKGLESNAVLPAAIQRAKINGTYVHLMGIASDAGVHGQIDHLVALLETCKRLGQTKVVVHLFTDGRDTGPFTGKTFIDLIEKHIARIGVGVIGSIMGRFYAMDRDNRWERVEQAYVTLTGRGAKKADIPVFPSATAAIQSYYDKPTSDNMKGDEFIIPCMIGKDIPDALSRRITNNDTVIFYNYRGDRPREIVQAFVLPNDEWAKVAPAPATPPETSIRGFDRGGKLALEFVCMTAYAEFLNPFVKVAFPKPAKMKNIAGEYWSALGLRQFRCAETEKYPHVTFFFNDSIDAAFPGETREMIQSPTDVKTYDQKPQMSAFGVRDAVLRRLNAADCEDVIVVNFANGDMVGHTGSLPAAITACETVDQCVGQIVEATLAKGGSLIVTADHGNAEQMWDPINNCPHTAHTTYTVPLIVVGAPFKGRKLRSGGRLGDIVPTGLAMMHLPQPAEMTGESLLS
jgi:2,3-bisphosphoglycerate-independent phosphoglycerate mutase